MADARRAFLEELIDDAGLFPPASLPMEPAAAQHAASRSGPHTWMLGRFICPASRLPELTGHLGTMERWRLSVILDGVSEGGEAALRGGLDACRSFLAEAEDRVSVELIETRLAVTDEASVDDLLAEMEHAGLGGAVPFLEVEPDEQLDAALDAVAGAPAGAKLRCGGATAAAFPSPAGVAAFLDGCRRRGLRCKATAGLHHPFRHTDPATGFVRHGFVNLVGAAVLAQDHDLGARDLERVVADEDPGAFQLDADRFRWRDLDADARAVEEARNSLFFAYGSCSFEEPVEDLLGLGILPLEP
jgi:hypothetical protein